MLWTKIAIAQASNGIRQHFSIYGCSSMLLHRFWYSATTEMTEDATGPQQKKTPTFLEHYLINSLGFSKQEATTTISKVQYTRLKPNRDPDLVVNFLQESGLDNTQTKKFVSRVPQLLFANVEKTLKPKFKVLQDLGLSGPDLADCIVRDGTFLHRGLDSHILPCLGVLRRALGCDENVVKAVKRSTYFLSGYAANRLGPNLLLLEKFGFSKEKILKIVLRNPRFVLQQTQWLEEVLRKAEHDFGIPRESSMFYQAIFVAGSLSVSNLKSKFEIFKSFGWGASDVLDMVKRQPQCLTISESKLRQGLTLFMKELGHTPGYLASHPKLLSHSMEKRVLPRYELLKVLYQKNLIKGLNIYSAVNLPEVQFMERYVLPYEDRVSDACKLYIKSVGK